MSSSSENAPLSRSQSPPRTGRSQRPSPPRQPLHERSKSQTNEIASPTIRIVDHSGPAVYSKSPYPSQSSHILRPGNAFAGPSYEDQGSRVSDRFATTNAVPPSRLEPAPETLVPKPAHLRKPDRASAASVTSDDDTITSGSPSFAFSYSPRFSQDTTPPLSPVLQGIDRIKSLEKVKEESPVPESVPTVRAVIPSAPSFGSPATQQLNSQTSKASLSSTSNSDASTIHYHYHHERSSSASSTNLSLQPTRQAKRPLYPYPRSKKRNTITGGTRPESFRHQQSSESLASSNKSRGSSDRPRSASAPVISIYAEQQATTESAFPIQYPVVRSSQASGSRAETRTLAKHSSRMTDRTYGHKWSSQLSTIHSESDRNSQSVASTSNRSHSRPREATIASIASSDDLSNPFDTAINVPRPLFSPNPLLEARDSDEHDDTLAELQSPPPLRHQRSGFFSRYSIDSRPSTSWSRPGTANSSQSDFVNFVANTIPAWARVYYRKGDRASLPAPDSSTEASDSRLNTAQSGPSMSPTEPTFPLSIYRPRNRPRHQSQNVTDSLVISEAPIEQEDLYVIGPVQNRLQQGYGTPRLYLDRRSTAHLSAWRAPSFNDSLGSLFNRSNRQILLFGIGFLFPLAWILGAVLPLPVKPELSKEATPSQVDVERVMARNLGPIDELQYQKARWWRNLNRIMSVVGVLLIGTIIALAVVAANMMSRS